MGVHIVAADINSTTNVEIKSYLLEGSVTNLEMSEENLKAASLEFDLFVGNSQDNRSDITPYKWLIGMWDGQPTADNCMFFGRVIQIDRSYGEGGQLVMHFLCESGLGFMADSTVFAPPYDIPEYNGITEYINACRVAHNMGFGQTNDVFPDRKAWVNARVCNGGYVPWQVIYNSYNSSIGMRSFVEYDYGNDTDLLSRIQQNAGDYGVNLMCDYHATPSDMRSERRVEINAFYTSATMRGGRPIPVDVVARHGININSVSSNNSISGVYSCVYATNKSGNEAYSENADMIAKYGRRQLRLTTDSETQAEVAQECATYASNLGLLDNVECDIDFIDLSLIDGGYVRPKVGQLWHVHSAPLGIHLRGWVKSCTWSADEPWSSHVVLHYCTEIEAE